MSVAALPEGPLVAWYGDDFTGTAAVMEVLSFAGVPSTVFLEPPTPTLLARFGALRGIGVAGTARSETPDWMRAHLPALFQALRATGAPFLHYKICSTLDSAPEIGSIGTAMEVAAAELSLRLMPVYPAAVPMGRYQAFGSLFAASPGGVFRLDRHPVMARHPVTPMDEADVVRHLARQTNLPLSTVDLACLHAGGGMAALSAAARPGGAGVALDSVSLADQTEVGRLLWQARGPDMLCFGSQGVEYALVAHWQAAGLLPAIPPPGSAGDVGPIAVVSGSVSPVTAAQIEDARAHGFHLVLPEAGDLVGSEAPAAEGAAVTEMLAALARGQDVLLATAQGPDDPAVARFRDWLSAGPMAPPEANRRLGQALGRILRRVVTVGGLRRAVISGGDTSGHAARELGVVALEALAPTIPGASISVARSEDPAIDGLQLALKGGQMGTPDFFRWVRQGGGLRA
jgi:uncharacterized protein YgbK (DUF1537 family)